MTNSPPDPIFRIGDMLVEAVNYCTCGMGEAGTYYGHEPYCGIEPIGPVNEARSP